MTEATRTILRARGWRIGAAGAASAALLLSACAADLDLDLGPSVSVSGGDLGCELIEQAVSEVYLESFGIEPQRSTYAQDYEPLAIREGERWCEFDALVDGLSVGVPGVIVVVAEGTIDESTEDAVSRIASTSFADRTLTLGGIGDDGLPVEGSIDIPADSPGFYGADGNRLDDGLVLVVVTGSSVGSDISHGQLADDVATRIVALADR